MPSALKARLLPFLVWATVTAVGCTLLSRNEMAVLREAFETDARISHRLMSQRAVQHDAVIATLALLQPGTPAQQLAHPEEQIAGVYPQIIAVARRDGDAAWGDAGLQAAERTSLQSHRAELANPRLDAGTYQMVLAARPSSFAITIDMRRAVPVSEWSMPIERSPVRVDLEHGGQRFNIQPGAPDLEQQGLQRFEFRKHLAADSQPFDVVVQRRVDWTELPWLWMVAWAAAVAGLQWAIGAWQRQRAAQRRAEELLRLGQVARLNTLGELAAGMAHELSQPLTAMLASTQAARRLLDEDAPAGETRATVQRAMDQAVGQARRATEVLGRLRRTVEKPGPSGPGEAVELLPVVRDTLNLLEPELRRRSIEPVLRQEQTVTVQADPVALEQIVHNLLMNALQALDHVAVGERQLHLSMTSENGMGLLVVEDTGPGIAPDALPRLFEPFFSTREGGLGLGLPLCETLAVGMGGRLGAHNNKPRGAVFTLALPLATSGSVPQEVQT